MYTTKQGGEHENMQSRIKAVRKAVGLTQSEFGERLGVKGNTVTGYETGLRAPSDAILLSICREFNVNEDWLRTGEGPMFLERSRDDELAAFFGDILSGQPDDFRRRLIAALSRLSVDEWAMVEHVATKLAEDMKKADQDES